MSDHDLSALIGKAVRRLKAAVDEVKLAQRKETSARKKLEELKKKRDRLSPETHVTDHAVLQYMARVAGFDVDALRADISHGLPNLPLDGVFPTTGAHGNYKLVIRNGAVVTIHTGMEKESTK